MHYPPKDVSWVHRYAPCPLNLRDIEERVAERGEGVDCAIVNRWAIKILSVLASLVVSDKTRLANAGN